MWVYVGALVHSAAAGQAATLSLPFPGLAEFSSRWYVYEFSTAMTQEFESEDDGY